jgi:hypothetical protein
MKRGAPDPRENLPVQHAGGGVDDGTVTLRIPGDPAYLRLARLAAADTGARAGLSVSDLEDLRIAVDELAYALIGTDHRGAPLTLKYRAARGLVEIDGMCPGRGEPAALSELAQTIVAVIADEHELHDDGETRRFHFVKRSRE